MTSQQTGWMLGLAALGMMAGLISMEIRELDSFSEMMTPRFIADTLAHIATVITAFIGGKLIPESRKSKYTRATDSTLGR